MLRRRKNNTGEYGHAALEFALVAMPTVLILLGVVVVGINLSKAVEVGQICRDADSMFVRGVDFSTTAAKNLLVQLGQNMNLQTDNTSSGVVILSKVQFVPSPLTCTSSCTGTYQLVQRLTVGNTTLPGTHYPTAASIPACGTGGASPTTDCQDSQGNIQGYQTYSNATISNFSSSLTLNANETSYVAEAYFQSSANLQIWFTSPGFYAQAFF